tara:strand:+ start:3902 stop:4435 length:534 start_codon:yes stop_codon:yes gene_type:complete
MLPTTESVIRKARFPTALRLLFALCLSNLSSAGSAQTAANLCLDQRVRHAAAEAIATWSQSYPFSRVIIGNDGQFGEVQSPRVQQIGSDFVLCLASYKLVKSGSSGTAYRVSIDHFLYRVTDTGRGYSITLDDLPPTLDGTALSSGDLIARFSINGRPYTDILEENQRRIESRRVGQ